MPVAVGANQTYPLRQLRDDALPRRGELRAPTRRNREFGDIMRHPKAGEVVGQFPTRFDKAPARQRLLKDPFQVARARQKPRSAVAALMAREGVSTATKFTRLTRRAKMTSAGFGGRATQNDDPAESAATENKPAWMSLLGDAPKPDADARAAAAHAKVLADKQKELRAADKFLGTIGGYSELEKSMQRNDARILAQAGKIDRSLRNTGEPQNPQAPKTSQSQMMDMMKSEAVMTQQLNMRYLAIQEKLDKGQDELLSNLMSTRDEAVKAAIDGESS